MAEQILPEYTPAHGLTSKERRTEFEVLQYIDGYRFIYDDKVVAAPAIVVTLAATHLMQFALYVGDVVLGVVYIIECLQLDALLGEIAQCHVGCIVDAIVDGLQHIVVCGRMTGVVEYYPVVLSRLDADVVSLLLAQGISFRFGQEGGIEFGVIVFEKLQYVWSLVS